MARVVLLSLVVLAWSACGGSGDASLDRAASPDVPADVGPGSDDRVDPGPADLPPADVPAADPGGTDVSPPPADAPDPGAQADPGEDPGASDPGPADVPDPGADAGGGCTTDEECPGGFCQFPDGACGGIGACAAKTVVCLIDWAPVCGCNGQTATNACIARSAPVNVASVGECGAPTCTDNSGCTASQYCLKAACGASAGVCGERPPACPEPGDPVCGCDGQTYAKACEAQVAGVNIARVGACDASDACDGDAACAGTDFCKKATCLKATGSCAARPATCPDLDAPVCGCDGITYANGCQAEAAGVNQESEGACEHETSCTDNAGCTPHQEYCQKDTCGAATGTCTRTPGICPHEYQPVCGCDGVTYGNACLARGVGQGVASDGACPAPGA